MWLQPAKRLVTVPAEKPIRSFRAWQSHCDGCWNGRKHDGHEELLVSIYVGVAWPPETQTARVIGSMYWHGDPIVALHTTAGIYGMRTLKRLVERIADHTARTTVTPQQLLYGVIRQWGDVVVHGDGWRSQYAEIERIYVPRSFPTERAVALAERYGVPVTTRKVA